MAVNEYRLIHWRIGPDAIPGVGNAVWKGDIDYANSVPEVFEVLNGGYEVVSHQIMPLAGGDLLLSLFFVKSTEAPDAPTTS